MALGTVEIALLVLLFAPVLSGLAVLDLLGRVDLQLDPAEGGRLTPAHLWCIAVVALPVAGPVLYHSLGRRAADRPGIDRSTAGDRVPCAAVTTGPIPVVV